MKAIIAALPLIAATLVAGLPATGSAEPRNGIAMHGEPALPADFAAFPYADPQAPKGGRLSLAKQGSFDSMNPLIVMGQPGEGVREYVYESLLARSVDEPFSLYAQIAQTVDTPEDRNWVIFQINPAARFSDGHPITPEDVLFSHALLRDHGRPNHRSYYAKVKTAEQIGRYGVRFTFEGSGDREMPLIMGLMPVLPKHLIDAERFERTSLAKPTGSGPYTVEKIDAGKRITYRRDPSYWGRDLPVARGRYNFDEIRIDYYRDAGAMFEAFKSGLVDFREEDDPTRWTEDYNFPSLRRGQVHKQALPIGVPAGMSALVFNTRRAPFSDIRVRKALIQLFDFEWINRTLYHGQLARTQSYFARSELSSHGRPADALERKLLMPFPGAVTPSILEGRYALPRSDGRGQNREGREAALKLLKEAGYALDRGRMVEEKTGKPLRIEMLAVSRVQERLMLTYSRALKRIGIQVRIRQIDSAQYQRRKQNFDFDVIQFYWPVSLSPGNEQLFRWGSEAAVTDGSFNYPGVRSKAADAMIAALLEAGEQTDFVSSVRALDRVLLSGDYVLPLFHLPTQWVAYWDRIARPDVTPLSGYALDSWWSRDAARAAKDGTTSP